MWVSSKETYKIYFYKDSIHKVILVSWLILLIMTYQLIVGKVWNLCNGHYIRIGLSLCKNGYVGPGSCLALVVYNSSEKQAPGKSLRLYLEDIDSP